MSANVALSDTFDQWRVKTNELLVMTQTDGMSNFIKLTDSTNSTSNTTGSIITAGGVGVSKSVVVGENLNVHGNIHANGNISSDGSLTFGDAGTDNIVINADINSNLIPNTNGSFDVGNSTQYWSNGFFESIKIHANSTLAMTALNIDSDDQDQQALVIDGEQTTVNTFQINSDALTSGEAMAIISASSDTTARSVVAIVNDDAAATGAVGLTVQQDSTGGGVVVDDNNSGIGISVDKDVAATVTGAVTPKGVFVDIDSAGVTGASTSADYYGVQVDLDNSATNNGTATVNMYGLHVDTRFADATGTTAAYGAHLNGQAGDTNYGVFATGTGGTNAYGGYFSAASGTGTNIGILVNAGVGLSTGNETAPDVDAGGICINHGANDTRAFTIKNSDVAHGAIVAALGATPETDTYFQVEKAIDTGGGVLMTGASDVGAGAAPGNSSTPQAVQIQGLSAGANATQTTAGVATVEVHGFAANSSAVQNATAGQNIFAVRTKNNGGSTVSLLLLDEDGDLLIDGAFDEATYDTFDDANLIRSLSIETSPSSAIIKNKWDEFVQYGRKDLMDAGILGKISPEEEAEGHRPLLNTTQLSRLHNGAIWQQQTEINNMKSAMYELMVEMAGEERALEKLKTHDIKLPGVTDRTKLVN